MKYPQVKKNPTGSSPGAVASKTRKSLVQIAQQWANSNMVSYHGHVANTSIVPRGSFHELKKKWTVAFSSDGMGAMLLLANFIISVVYGMGINKAIGNRSKSTKQNTTLQTKKWTQVSKMVMYILYQGCSNAISAIHPYIPVRQVGFLQKMGFKRHALLFMVCTMLSKA